MEVVLFLLVVAGIMVFFVWLGYEINRPVAKNSTEDGSEKSKQELVMFCMKCGQAMPTDARFCARCGAPVATLAEISPAAHSKPPSASAEETLSKTPIAIAPAKDLDARIYWTGAIVLLVFVVGVIVAVSERTPEEQKKPLAAVAVEQPNPVAPSPTVNPADLKQQVLDEVGKTARANFINGLREEFRNAGFDASASDVHGDLTIVSDAMKLKPDRDELVRRMFGPAVRRNLCTIGFKTLTVQNGFLLGDGDTYSLGCPETKEEKAARLEGDRAARENYVDELRGKLGSEMQLQEQGNELVLTSASFNDLTPAMIRANWGVMFNGEPGRNLCRIGFRGIRVRGTVGDTGTFISFACGSRSTQ